MKIKYTLLIIFFLNLNLFSQNLSIKYDILTDFNNEFEKPYESSSVLEIENELSMFKVFKKSNLQLKFKDSTFGAGKEIKSNKDTLLIVKNFKNKTIISDELYFFKYLTVLDTLDLFDWKISTEHENILNYDCNIAYTKFRGRNYKAYFTKKIKKFDGPYKFNGLPGLILKIEVIDKNCTFQIIATEINFNAINEKLNASNKFEFNYADFKNKYIKKYHALNNYAEQNGKQAGFSKGGLEILIND